MKLQWLKPIPVKLQKSYFTECSNDLKDIVKDMFININNLNIGKTLFDEYLDYENKLISVNTSELFISHKYHALFDCFTFKTFFIFCMNSIMNKSINILHPFTKQLISTDKYFILTGNINIYIQDTPICNYYFETENAVLGMSVGAFTPTHNKKSSSSMHVGFLYFIDLKTKQILHYNYSEYIYNFTKCKYFTDLLAVLNTYNKYIKQPTTTLIFGFQQNIGHNMMNSMTGLYILDTFNMLKNIDNAIIGPFDIYDAKYILREKIKNILYTNNLIYLNGMWNTGVCLSYNHFFMSNKFNTYIRNRFNYCLLKVKSISYIDQITTNINKIKEKYNPIINIVLRYAEGYFESQYSIISDIINVLITEYPNMFILFDGMCGYSNNNICIQNDISDLERNYNTLVEKIVNNITTTNYMSLIGLPYYTILQYTDISTICIYQIGSGTTLSEFISRKNGIIFGRKNASAYPEIEKIIIESAPYTEYIDNTYCIYNKHDVLESIDSVNLIKNISKLISNETNLVCSKSL